VDFSIQEFNKLTLHVLILKIYKISKKILLFFKHFIVMKVYSQFLKIFLKIVQIKFSSTIVPSSILSLNVP